MLTFLAPDTSFRPILTTPELQKRYETVDRELFMQVGVLNGVIQMGTLTIQIRNQKHRNHIRQYHSFVRKR